MDNLVMHPTSPGMFEGELSPGGGSPTMEEIASFDMVGNQDISEQVSQKSKSTPSTALSGQRRSKTNKVAAVQEKPKFAKEEYARAFF